MLVVCCGMYRSGSTLQYQIASALVEAAGVGSRAGWDWDSADLSLARPGFPASVIKVHEPHPTPGIEAGLDPDGAAYIYSHRDLRDVVVSYAAKMAVDLSVPPDAANTAWMDVMMRANAHFISRRHVLVRAYDEIVADVSGEARAIRDFLRLQVDDGACAAIAADLSIDRQRERMDQVARAKGTGWDAASLVHHNHIRDGRSGQWVTQLPAPWVEYVERTHGGEGGWLRANGYAAAVAAGAGVR